MDGLLTPRAATALAVLLAVGLVLVGLVEETPAPAGDASSTHVVYVVGPTALLHSGNITAAPATALAVLQGLAAQQGFAIVVDDLPGCSFDYVRAVAGHSESSSGGWNFYLRSTSAWEWQDEAASCKSLADGDDVLWCWVEPDERCAVYPD